MYDPPLLAKAWLPFSSCPSGAGILGKVASHGPVHSVQGDWLSDTPDALPVKQLLAAHFFEITNATGFGPVKPETDRKEGW